MDRFSVVETVLSSIKRQAACTGGKLMWVDYQDGHGAMLKSQLWLPGDLDTFFSMDEERRSEALVLKFPIL